MHKIFLMHTMHKAMIPSLVCHQQRHKMQTKQAQHSSHADVAYIPYIRMSVMSRYRLGTIRLNILKSLPNRGI